MMWCENRTLCYIAEISGDEIVGAGKVAVSYT